MTKTWQTQDGAIALDESSITIWFDKGAGRKQKAAYSPRRFPLTAVESVESWTSMRHNAWVVTLVLVGETHRRSNPKRDPNSVHVRIHERRGIVRALRDAVASVPLKEPDAGLLSGMAIPWRPSASSDVAPKERPASGLPRTPTTPRPPAPPLELPDKD
jgi:hypothetical protein